MAHKWLSVTVAGAPKDAERGNRSVLKVIDRSYSMSWTLDQLARDCAKQVEGLQPGDVYSFGYFSSPGQFGWVLKGFRIAGKPDVELIKAAIEKNKSPLGTTCFSGILDSLAQVVVDLSVFNLPTDFFFLTDGHPVVPNVPKEIEASLGAMGRAAPLIANAMIVGYGDYYNASFLSKLAEVAGGQLVHAADARQMGKWIAEFGGMKGDARVRVQLTHPLSADGLAVGINQADKTVVLLQPDEFERVMVQPGTVIFSESVFGGPVKQETMELGDMAMALARLQRGDVNIATDLLQELGDTRLVRLVSSAWTNAEIGRAADEIRAAIFTPGMRFKEGKRVGQPIDPRAFCVLDALEILASDREAVFFPFSPDFDYHRIGPKSEVDGDFPPFEADKLAGCPIGNFVWHSARLNLSVTTRIPGTVKLRGDAAKYGFAQVYPTSVWRTYTIVKDGHLNVDRLPIRASRATIDRLSREQIVEQYEDGATQPGGVEYGVVVLSRLPIINRAMSEGKASAAALAKVVWVEQQYEAEFKVYNSLRKQFAPEVEQKMAGLSPEQEAYLAANGIGKGGYAVPVKKSAVTDEYTTKELTITYKGFSSLPSLAEIQKRRAEGKALTPGMKLMLPALEAFEKARLLDKNGEPIDLGATLRWLDDRLALVKGFLREVRREIQATKFKVVLARRRFVEFTDTADEHVLIVDGREVTVRLREVQQEF